MTRYKIPCSWEEYGNRRYWWYECDADNLQDAVNQAAKEKNPDGSSFKINMAILEEVYNDEAIGIIW